MRERYGQGNKDNPFLKSILFLQVEGRGLWAQRVRAAEILICTAVASMHVLGLFSWCPNGLLEPLPAAQSPLRGTAPCSSFAARGGQGSTGQGRDFKDGMQASHKAGCVQLTV